LTKIKETKTEISDKINKRLLIFVVCDFSNDIVK
jgi:hypothetical protein